MCWPWQRTRQAVNHLTVAVNLLREELREGLAKMTTEVQNMVDAVTELKGQVTSIVGVVNKLADLFAAAKEDPVEIQTLADDVKAQSQAIAAAVLAHPLPGDTPPVPPPAL